MLHRLLLLLLLLLTGVLVRILLQRQVELVVVGLQGRDKCWLTVALSFTHLVVFHDLLV